MYFIDIYNVKKNTTEKKVFYIWNSNSNSNPKKIFIYTTEKKKNTSINEWMDESMNQWIKASLK